MSGRVLKFDISQHQAVQELLPWYIAQTLDPHESALVQEHLQACTQCQADLEWQTKLCGALPDDAAVPDMESALARLQPQLHGGRHRWRAALESCRRWWRRSDGRGTWMRWALAAQAIAIAGLLLMRPPVPGTDGAAFHALGSAANAAAANAVIKFRPDTSERELRRILTESGARVVDGPTVTDAYLIELPSARRSAAIGRMRAEPAVALAEPLDGGDRQ
jgi:hypothetical protein